MLILYYATAFTKNQFLQDHDGIGYVAMPKSQSFLLKLLMGNGKSNDTNDLFHNHPMKNATHRFDRSSICSHNRRSRLCRTGALTGVFAPAFVAFMFTCAARAQTGDTNIWFGPGAGFNNWSDSANWTNATAGGQTGLAGGDDVKFFNTGSVGTVSNIDNVVDTSVSIGSLVYGNTNGFHTTLITNGATLSITNTGGLSVFTPGDPGSAITIWATLIGPGGTLNLDNTNANLVINQGQGSGGAPRAVLDLSGLDNFTANLNRIGIGTTTLPNPSGANQRDTGTLFLAKTNTITVNYADTLADYETANKLNGLEMSRNPGNSAGFNYLYLGISNVFYIDSLGIGRDKSTAGRYSGIMAFNPAFLPDAPVAYFRGTGGNSSAVTWWGIGDMNNSSSSSQTACGTNDFTGGYVDALVNTMSLSRDGSPSSTASGVNIGVLNFNNGRIEVSTLLLGNQSLGPGTSSTKNEGFMNLTGAGATLMVDHVLTLGYTTQNSTAAQGTFGVLNVTGGTVGANNITVGAATTSTNNAINLVNGTLIVTNTLATNSAGLYALTLSSSTLGLTVPADGSLRGLVHNLHTAGAANVIQLDPNPVIFSSYPQQFPLLKYTTWTGANTFALASIPPWAPGATVVSNGADQSLDLVLPHDPRPVITNAFRQPVSVPTYPNPGDNVTLSIGVSPDSVTPLGYQWYFNSTPLADGPVGDGSTNSGSATSALTIFDSQTNETGNYTVVITNVYGATTSSVWSLIVSTNPVAPTITGPAGVTVIQGNTASLQTIVAGKPAPVLQWLFNGSALTDGPGPSGGSTISGSGTSTLTLSNPQYPGDQGTYSLMASNVAGLATNNTVVTVMVPPAISAEPQNLVVTNTQSASFSVTASGVPAPTYQWDKNGVPISPLVNNTATNAAFNIVSASPGDIATYSCVVANAAGTTNTTGATLTVNSTGLQAVSLSPANGQTGVCYDTPLYLTFSQPPVLNTQGTIRIYNVTNSTTPVDTIDLSLNQTLQTPYAVNVQQRTIAGDTFNTFPVIITGNTAAILPHLDLLTSNQTYYVTVDDGVFTDTNGAYFTGITATNAWQFTTKPGGPANPTNLVVAADGSGDFDTVQGAVDSVPSNNTTPTTINVRNGTYAEIVDVKSKNNLDFRGQSRDGVMIGYPNNNNVNAGAPWRAAFIVNGNDCSFENLTLTNMTPKGGSQAEAIDVEGSRAIFLNMNLDSYQDTFLIHSAGKLVYFQDCLIQGDTDFNWGYGTVFWTNCELRVMSPGGHVTQPRSPAGQNGFSFVNCQVTAGSAGVTSADLGRSINTPTTPAEVIFSQCLMGDFVTGYNSDAGTNFWDYADSNLTATLPKTLAYSTHLSASDPIVSVALSATNWLYGWQPQMAPNIIGQPAGQTVNAGQGVSFTVNATGIPDPTYQWLKDGTNLVGQTGATLSITNASGLDIGTYSVIVSNGSGSVTSSNAVLTVNAPTTPATIVAPSVDNSGNVQFTISGPAGSAGFGYRVWATTNLALTPVTSTWTLLTNGVFDTTPTIFTDPAGTLPQRFYLITVP